MTTRLSFVFETVDKDFSVNERMGMQKSKEKVSTKRSTGDVGLGGQKKPAEAQTDSNLNQEPTESDSEESRYSSDSLLSHPSISSISTANGDVIKYQLRGIHLQRSH